MGYIYKTTNLINGKIYVGKSLYLPDGYLGSGLRLSGAIKKYGKNNFRREILEECDNSLLSDREKHWIQNLDSTNPSVGYNISIGGTGGNHYFASLDDTQRLEHNKKISIALSGRINGPHSDQAKANMSRAYQNHLAQNPTWHAERADKKRLTYTCIDHINKIKYVVNNLQKFCAEHGLSFASMQHNSRSCATIYVDQWSCRKGQLEGDAETIILMIKQEMIDKHQQRLTKTRARNRSGSANPNARKIIMVHEDGRTVAFDGNLYKDCKNLTGCGYIKLLPLVKGLVDIIDGWKIKND